MLRPRLPLFTAGTKTNARPVMAVAVAFIVVVCLSLLAATGWDRWLAYEDRLQQADITTSNMTRALAQHAEDSVKLADTILLGMVERVETDGTGAAALARLRSLLTKRVAALPLLHGLFLYDEEGRWLANSQPQVVPNVNNADREYFVFHRTHADRGPHIGVPVRSRSTGDWIIPISRRIEHRDGSFAGVALATIKMTHFKAFYESFDTGRAGAIFLALDNGTVLVRRPFDESMIGMDISNGPVFREYRSMGPIGTVMLTSRVDKVKRLYSYRHLDAYPLVVATALSKQEIFANWLAATYRAFIVIAVLMGVIGMLGLHLLRQIRIGERRETELHAAKNALETDNRSLETLAAHDGLTGLANRRQFETVLKDEFYRAMRNRTPLALVMLDTDYFKQYNDMYGHPAGDECLRRISMAIKTAHQRAGDLAARYGGEEFAVLLPGTDRAGALAVAEKIRVAVLDLQMTHAASPIGTLTISAGAESCLPVKDGGAPLDLVRAADLALYRAKSMGRNCAAVGPT
jgi:diguanylate cyclase (GGDEF)-like protein